MSAQIAKQPRIVIGVAVGDSMHSDFVKQLLKIQQVYKNTVEDIFFDHLKPIEFARNSIFARFLMDYPYATHLLMLDADVLLPFDAIPRFLEGDNQLVSGILVQKAPPFYPLLNVRVGPNVYRFALDWDKKSRYVVVDSVGFGAFMIRRDVPQIMPPPWSKCVNQSEDYFFSMTNDMIVSGLPTQYASECKKGEQILLRDGSYSTILDIHKRYLEDLIFSFRPWYCLPIKVTENHPLLILRDNREQWEYSQNIKVNDSLFIPRPQPLPEISTLNIYDYSKDLHLMHGLNYLRLVASHKSCDKIPYELSLNPKICRFIGLYIAEGGPVANGYQTSFTFHPSETKYIDEVIQTGKEYFNAEGSVFDDKTSNATRVSFSSKILTILLTKLTGGKANHKHLPFFWNNLNDKNLLALIQAVQDGDGRSKDNGYNQKGVMHTTSLILENELRQGYLRLKDFRNYILYKPQYSKYHKQKIIEEEYGWWTPIRTIERIVYSGYVYDFTVNAPDYQKKTYTINGIVSHNCEKAQAYGMRLVVDNAINCAHIGTYRYTLADFENNFKAREVAKSASMGVRLA